MYETFFGLNAWWAYDEAIEMFGLEMPSTRSEHMKGEKETYILYTFYNETQGKVSFALEEGDITIQFFNPYILLEEKPTSWFKLLLGKLPWI